MTDPLQIATDLSQFGIAGLVIWWLHSHLTYIHTRLNTLSKVEEILKECSHVLSEIDKHIEKMCNDNDELLIKLTQVLERISLYREHK